MLTGACLLLAMGVFFSILLAEPTYQGKRLSHWLADLNGTNYVQREIAAAAIAKIGEPAMPILIHALEKKQTLADRVLLRITPKLPPMVARKLPMPMSSATAQFNAAVAVAAFGPAGSNAAPALVQNLGDPNQAVVSRCTFALSRIGTPAIPALLAGLSSTNSRINSGVYNVLNDPRLLQSDPQTSERIALAVALQIHGASPAVTQQLFALLKELGFSARPVWETLAHDGNPETRLTAALALAQAGVVKTELRATYMNGLGSKNPIILASSIQALGRLKDEAKEAVPALRELQRSPTDSLKHAATLALIQIDSGVEQEVPVLLELVNSRDYAIRTSAITLLSGVESARPRLMAALSEQIKINNRLQRAQLAFELRQLGKDAAPVVPALVHILETEFPEDNLTIISLLGYIGPDASAAAPTLQELLKGSNERVKLAAAAALLQIDPSAGSSADAILGLALSSNRSIQVNATLLMVSDPALRARLIPALTDRIKTSNKLERARYVLLLPQLGAEAKAVVPMLVNILETEPAQDNLSVILALGNMAGEATNALPVLRKLAADTATDRGDLAKEAIDKIEGRVLAVRVQTAPRAQTGPLPVVRGVGR